MPTQRNASSITCQEVANLATEFMENRLPAAPRAKVSLHLKSCAPCRTYVQQLTAVRDSLPNLPGATMPDRMRKLLVQRLAGIAGDTDS